MVELSDKNQQLLDGEIKMDDNLKRIYRKTGIFVFTAVLILLFLILFIAHQQRTFSKKYNFYTIFDDAIGLEKTSPITFKGTEIGKVKEYHFNAEHNVEVRFQIFNEFRELIVEHSAITKSTGPLGGRATLDFLMGPIDGNIAEEESLIPSLDMEEGQRLLAEKKIKARTDKISQIISNFGTFVSNLNRDDNYDQGSIFRLLYHLASVAENTNHTMTNLNSILADLQKDHNDADGALFRFFVNAADLAEDIRISNSLLAQNLMDLNVLIQNYTNPEDMLTKMIDPTGRNIITPLNQNLKILEKNLEDINKLIEFFHYQTPEIAILMSETKSTLSELQKTLQGINNNPLLRGGIKQDELPVSGERIRPMEEE